MVLHEIFMEYRFFKRGPRGRISKNVLCLCFLDRRKAFDTVARNILFRELSSAGVRGEILRVIQNLFSRNLANVFVDGLLSPDFFNSKLVMCQNCGSKVHFR